VRAPDARLDVIYPRLGGQVSEPSAHGPSEVPSVMARDQVDEQIGQYDVGLEPPRAAASPFVMLGVTMS
jgi:hypothetical protein